MGNLPAMPPLVLCTSLLLAGLGRAVPREIEAARVEVVRAYAEMVSQQHGRAVSAARKLEEEIKSLVREPDAPGLAAARNAWRVARSEFLRLEPLRFSSTPVDDDDGPLPRMDGLMRDRGTAVEAFIARLDRSGSLSVDSLKKAVLAEPESRISGFPALEYVLWRGAAPMADRKRREFLSACADLLLTDMEGLAAEWAPGRLGNFRAMFTEGTDASLQGILSALCLLSEAELGATRLQMALDTATRGELPSAMSGTIRDDLIASISGILQFGQSLRPLIIAMDQTLWTTLDRQFQATSQLATDLPPDLCKSEPAVRDRIAELISALEAQAATLRGVGKRLGIPLPMEILSGDESTENLHLPIPTEPAAHSGGGCTIFHGGSESFGRVLANASVETRRYFIIGNSFFTDPRVPSGPDAGVRGGLGPLYHAAACASCHIRGGRGEVPKQGPWPDEPGLMIRISQPGNDSHGGPAPDQQYGLQLAPLAIPPAEPAIAARLAWKETVGSFADGERFSLREPRPEIRKWQHGPPAPSSVTGLRFAPPVFGLGLLEAIDEADILSGHGKANYVWDSERNERRLGRFGWKANVADLRQQTIKAFAADMGVVHDGPVPEISDTLLSRVVTYVRALAPPGRRSLDDPAVQHGEAHFRLLGCAACHRETFTTGANSELPELRHQSIHPYTDLLLHDMGDGLADHRPDYLATGREWRTPPLWGLGLNDTVNGHTAMLHDARARTLSEAILWHGGEASAAATAFRNLPASQRGELLSFLRSL